MAQYEYLLPQVATGTFSGGSFRTTFVIVNNNSTAAFLEIALTADDGSALSVNMPGLGSGSEFPIMLAAGATFVYQTDGTGDLRAGAATVTSTQALGVSAVFAVYDTAGHFQTEAGVGNSAPATEFVIPIDTTGNFNTGVALYNPAATDASLTLKLIGLNGQQTSQATLTLGPSRHVARLISGAGQLFPTATNFRGTMVISSSVAVAAVTLRQNSAPLSYTSLPAVPRSEGKTQFSLPQVANGSFAQGSFRTTFVLFNMSQVPSTSVLTLTQDNGSPFPVKMVGGGASSNTHPVVLQPGGAAFLETDGTGGLAAGAATIQTVTGTIGAAAIFTVYDSQGKFATEAGVGDSPALTAMTIPVDIGSGYDTGVAFFNPGTAATTLSLNLFDSEGVAAGTTQLGLGVKNHTATFVSQLFAGKTLFRGSLAIVSSAGGIAAITLRQNSNPLSYTTLPVTSGTAQGGGSPTGSPLLPKEKSGVTAVGDLTVNETLNAGFKLSGTVKGAAITSLVSARTTSGDIYSGSVNYLTQKYLLIVPQGTYTLGVCYMPSPSMGGTTLCTYTDPTAVTVNSDTTRDITVSAVTTYAVSGTITGLTNLPSTSNLTLTLTSSDNKVMGVFSVDTTGAFQGQLPNGTYNAGLTVPQIKHTNTQTQHMNIFSLGNLTVSGSGTSRSFTVPPAAKISGTVRFTAPCAINDDAYVYAVDNAAGSLIGIEGCAFPPATSLVTIDPAGPYQLTLARDRTYTLSVVLPVLKDSVEIGTINYPTTGIVQALGGDVNINMDVPVLPSIITLSGKVTDGSGAGVANVGVSAYTAQVAGTTNLRFSASAQTDGSGNYTMKILQGTGYTISFDPPQPTP